MKHLYILLSLQTLLFAEVAKIINLDLFNNQNPAVLTDIRGDKIHPVVIFNALFKDVRSQTAPSYTDESFYLDVKASRRLGNLVLFVNAASKYYSALKYSGGGYSQTSDMFLEIAVATPLLNDADLGLSYFIQKLDDNQTIGRMQIGFRKMDNFLYGLVIGMQSLSTDTQPTNLSPYFTLGMASPEDRSLSTWDTGLTYRLATPTQAQTIEAYGQIQSDELFQDRVGFRYDYLKSYALSGLSSELITHKFRLHTSMESMKEENTFITYFVSYKNEVRGDTSSFDFEVGVALRGFYD